MAPHADDHLYKNLWNPCSECRCVIQFTKAQFMQAAWVFKIHDNKSFTAALLCLVRTDYDASCDAVLKAQLYGQKEITVQSHIHQFRRASEDWEAESRQEEV